MKQDHRHALALAIDRGLLEISGKPKGTLFLNACPIPGLSEELKVGLSCEQRFKTNFRALQELGYNVSPELGLSKAKSAIVIAGRSRRLNEFNIMKAWNCCENNGRILIVGDKTSGINALRRWTANWTSIVESFSKYHAISFAIEKSGPELPMPDLSIQIDGYARSQGMFSAEGPDQGSELLVQHFDHRIGGKVADFGAGWGYLSAELIERSNRVSSLELYEADWHSLETAKTNLKEVDIPIEFQWIDVITEFRKHVVDWVIMNPPFHVGRAAVPEIGQKFIQVAASTLPTGGKLLMVANRNLPYEKTLASCFRNFETLTDEKGFKVIEGRK